MIGSTWMAMGGVLALLGALMGVLKLVQQSVEIHPELSRKIIHITMGLVTLSFPWLFDATWPVWTLGILSAVMLVGIRSVRALNQQLGSVLGGVKRESWGEIYFPLSVCLLFTLSQKAADSHLLYVLPLLVLTFADAVAALIGVRYGNWHYTTLDGKKSVEGSLAFLLVAFFSVHIPLLLVSDVGRAETLLIGCLLGMVAMMFEAITWRGLDNLILPLACYFLLKAYLIHPAEELLTHLWVSLGLALFVWIYQSRTTLTGSGLPCAVLVGYLSWSLGGLIWLVPPLFLFVSYAVLWPNIEANRDRIHNVDAVLAVSLTGLAWLFLAQLLEDPAQLFLPYAVTFAAHGAMIGVAQLKRAYPQLTLSRCLGTTISMGWGLGLVPIVCCAFPHTTWLVLTTLGLCGVAVSAGLFYYWQPNLAVCPSDGPRWWRQASCSWLGSLLGLLPLVFPLS